MGASCYCDIEIIHLRNDRGKVDTYRTKASLSGISVKKVDVPVSVGCRRYVERHVLEVNRETPLA